MSYVPSKTKPYITPEEFSIILRRKDTVKQTIENPTASSTIYSNIIQITRNGHWTFLVYTSDGDPLSFVIQFGTESDGSDMHDLVGAELSSSDYEIGKWNYIHADINAGYCRLAITTGANAPSSIEVVFSGRPI